MCSTPGSDTDCECSNRRSLTLFLAQRRKRLLAASAEENEAGQLSPGAVAPHHGKAGADEAAQRAHVMQMHVGFLPQSLQHTLPQSILNETLVHA